MKEETAGVSIFPWFQMRNLFLGRVEGFFLDLGES